MPAFSLTDISTKPGVYLYKDISGDIIYIGKAKNLRKRVSQYFQKEHEDLKTQHLVEHIHDIDTIITKNEVEALILESNLIRQHKPKYNIDLKYGLRYAWIVITNEKYPRLITARSIGIDGEYFGPFVSGTLRVALLDILRKKFFIRTCRALPKKACLRYHINICKAPCIKKQTVDEYNENIERVRAYLKGNSDKLIKKLQQKIKEQSEKLEFEKAKITKDQIDALTYLQKRIITENQRLEEEDVIHYRKGEKTKIIVLSYSRGVLREKQEFTLADEENILEKFIKRLYDIAPPPPQIIIPHEIDPSIEEWLNDKAKRKVHITVPKRGLKKELLDMAKENLDATLIEHELITREIYHNLKINNVRTIECFDISHLGGTNTVGAMVQFRDGKPAKSNYRKFKIRTVEGVDDFRSIHEIVSRRYKQLLEEAKKEGKEVFPDLIVIDGGEQQLVFAVKALEEIGLDIPIIGLAKKFEEIYIPGNKQPKKFDKDSRMMKTFIQARDEAHRFGITYQRLLRSKKLKE